MHKWHTGKFTCQDVLELACAAQDQGTPGIDRLAMHDLKTASRNLVAAIGYPEKAPPIRIIELSGPKPGTKVQLPIICPIDSLEKMIAEKKIKVSSFAQGRAWPYCIRLAHAEK